MTTPNFVPGPIACGGAAVNDFRLTTHLPPEAAPAVIERDRLHMAARPGFNRKLLPLRVERDTGVAYSGGRYLLDTLEDARAFVDWVETGFVLDGTHFLRRPDFADIQIRVMRVLGAWDFRDVHRTQQVCRTEIWSLAKTGAADSIETLWPALRDEAAERGRSSLWLLHDDDQGQVCLVTIAERSANPNGAGPDFRSIEALEKAPSQGEEWERSGWARKVFDRTHWVFSIWFPRRDGRDLDPPVWPNSPPLPAAGPGSRHA